MLPKEASARTLERLFRSKPVVELGAFYRSLKTRSRMSVFRRLKELDYLSSYSHAGRYYTLADIPRFDEHGLWFYQGIGFSQAGTLKSTVARLVDIARAGHTHPELQQLLRVRVQNTLLDLVREERIDRQRLDGRYVYLSVQSDRAGEQIAARGERLAGARKEPLPLPPATMIELLIEAIRSGQVKAAPSEIAERLKARGLVVTAEEVEAVFVRYGIDPGKKTAG
ncbi:MAG: hypothetical protein V1755_06820 [Chloroflexota bacterium]